MKYILALLLAATLVSAQDKEVTIKVVPVAGNIHMLVGEGGNIGLCTGSDGTFMIDDQFAPLTEKIKAAVATITENPVKFLVNTHYHYDHTGGNENFGKSAAIIMAHKNVRKRLSAGQFMKDFGSQVPPAPKEALPVITFTKDMTVHLNDEEIHIFHVANAHTDGDAMIWFKKANVLHMGDCFFNGLYPYFDIHAGGSLAGVIKTADMILKKLDDNTKIIPGHGPVATKKDLQAFHDLLLDVHTKVAKLIKEGKSLDEVKAAKPTAAYDEKWGKAFLSPEKWTELVYNDLVRNK